MSVEPTPPEYNPFPRDPDETPWDRSERERMLREQKELQKEIMAGSGDDLAQMMSKLAPAMEQGLQGTFARGLAHPVDTEGTDDDAS